MPGSSLSDGPPRWSLIFPVPAVVHYHFRITLGTDLPEIFGKAVTQPGPLSGSRSVAAWKTEGNNRWGERSGRLPPPKEGREKVSKKGASIVTIVILDGFNKEGEENILYAPCHPENCVSNEFPDNLIFP